MKSHYEPSHRMSHCINRTQLFIHHSLTNLSSNSSFSLNCSSSHSRTRLHLHRIFIFIFFFFFIFAFSVHTPFLSLTILLTNPLTIPLAKHLKTHLITPLATPTHPTIHHLPTATHTRWPSILLAPLLHLNLHPLPHLKPRPEHMALILHHLTLPILPPYG